MKTVESYLLEKGLKIWTKGENKRIYINDLNVIGIEKVSNNPKGYRKVTMVYDIVADKFSWNGSTNSMDATIEQLIALIRSEVAESKKEEIEAVEVKIIEAYEANTNEPVEARFEISLTDEELQLLENIKQVVWWEHCENGNYDIVFNPDK